MMFKNYLKISLRNIKKQKGYSFINIFGLALGLTISILITNYVYFETSYDRYHKNANRIYRLVAEYEDRNHNIRQSPLLEASAGPSMKAEFPEIEDAARLFSYTWKETALISNGEKQFHESRFFLADPTIFNVFSYRFLKGDSKFALQNLNSIVITKSMAEKYFGQTEPMGKILSVTNLGKNDFVITGIIEDIPENSHFKFDFIASMKSGNSLYWKNFDQGWRGGSFYTYFKISDQTSAELLEKKFPDFISKFRENYKLSLQPLTDIHLHSHTSYEIEPNNSMTNIYFLSFIGLFILVIACINYINLATARASIRAKEVGLRKVVGAFRIQLVHQFLSESVLFSFLALPFAFLFAELLQPVFSQILNKKLEIAIFNHVGLLGIILFLILLVGIISGSYPAFFVSKYQPITVLRSMNRSKTKRSNSRNILVIFQFAISVAFIIITLTTQKQMDFIKSSDPGFDKDHILIINEKDYETQQNYPQFKNEINQYPGIQHVTASFALPSDIRFKHLILTDNLKDEDDVRMDWIGVDFDFLETYGIELKEGRNFSSQHPTDSEIAYILNETAVKQLGLSEPIGKSFQLSNRRLKHASFKKGKIIGVVKDFHSRSYHSKIEPLVLKINKEDRKYISIRVQPESLSNTINFIKSKWEKINPDRPFEYSFFDEYFNRMYQADAQNQYIFRITSLLAIIIASLGLFGLASFKAARRTKELGIRKVLGASTTSIVTLLSKDFLKLVFVGNLIAWPIAYWFVKNWLQNFAYHTDLQIWLFVFSGSFTLLVVAFTISITSVKTALANPIKSLRYE